MAFSKTNHLGHCLYHVPGAQGSMWNGFNEFVWWCSAGRKQFCRPHVQLWMCIRLISKPPDVPPMKTEAIKSVPVSGPSQHYVWMVSVLLICFPDVWLRDGVSGHQARWQSCPAASQGRAVQRGLRLKSAQLVSACVSGKAQHPVKAVLQLETV